MRELFLDKPENEKFKRENYFTIFFTLFESNMPGFLGFAQGINVNNAIMLAGREKENVLAHEVLHGLGLQHTHYDRGTTAKFIFVLRETTNIMSYASNNISLWRWQWHLINREISEK